MQDCLNLLTSRELAKRLGVTAGTIKRWRSQGRIPAIEITAKTVRYDPADVRRALDQEVRSDD